MNEIFGTITYKSGRQRKFTFDNSKATEQIKINQRLIDDMTSLINRSNGYMCFETLEYGSVSVNLSNVEDICLKLIESK